jgi:hypothetical protein
VERDKPKKIGIGWTNFAAVAMETKKGRCLIKASPRNRMDKNVWKNNNN